MFTLSSILSTRSYAEASSGSKGLWIILNPCTDNHVAWATLPMNVVPYLTEDNYIPVTVPTLVGTPPQQMNLTVDVAFGDLLTYGSDCILCAGTTMFDPLLSSTFKVCPYFYFR